MRGKIVCIEGNDRVGKHTQAMLLMEHIKSKGYDVQCLSFPNYGSLQAKPVESYLAGDFPTLEPLEASILYAFDRSVTIREQNIKPFLKNGGVLILDRYTTSNIVYQVARSFKDDDEVDVASKDVFNLCYKIETLEYSLLELPRPDVVVYLHLDKDHNKLFDNAEAKGLKNDFHERDDKLLHRVSEVGIQLAQKCGWRIIECFDEETQNVYLKEEISEKIIEELAKDMNIL